MEKVTMNARGPTSIFCPHTDYADFSHHAKRNLRTMYPSFMLAVRAQGIGEVAETNPQSEFVSEATTQPGPERGHRRWPSRSLAKPGFFRSKKCAQTTILMRYGAI
jgi:hypothetical protein